jgi:hypothetical protein
MASRLRFVAARRRGDEARFADRAMCIDAGEASFAARRG